MIPRAQAIEVLAREHFDGVVIGGAITGAGVALDAASRGYSAEVAYAPRHEQAATIGDVLLRRTRVGLLAARRAIAIGTLEPLADALGRECGWDVRRHAAEVSGFRSEARAEGIVVAPVAL